MSLAGKTVAFTGEMVGMTRKEASAIAQAAGAMVASATSKNIDFLFAGNGATPAKTMKAQQNGVQVMAAPQFSQFTAGIKAPTPMVAAPVLQSYTAPMVQYPTAVPAKAPRGRRPAAAVAAPMNEAPTTGAMPWETEVVGEVAAPATAAPIMQTYAAPTQTYAAPTQTYAAPAPVAPMAQPVFDNKAVTLPGKSLSFTGTLETATRAEAGAMAAQAGATVHHAVTPQTDYLVCGATPGQVKVIAAQAAGVRSVTEGQFMKAAIPAVNAMPEVQTYAAAPAQTYAAPAPVMATRGRKPRVAAPLMAAPAAPVATPMLEAPTTGAMPWETEVVGEVAAPAMAAPKVRAPRKVAAPTQAYAAPVQAYAAPSPVAQMGAVSLAGQNVVFTGALQVNRIIAATMVSKAGGIPQATLTAKTNLLVCGANAGPKMAKAQAMGIRVITEAEFVGACHF